ncbi:Elongation of very long chain fatty acids protein-like 7 [Homarus americanus]|uniref:Elongation of very long chain fatty acids protein-like 7 n=1 Tax=Homarus americanus TaxID=6706 RepID=A0A8J5N3K7_HOMAM|nr:Elongation of very long chain fatty acids protein-like 7 [Homarus americanus]
MFFYLQLKHKIVDPEEKVLNMAPSESYHDHPSSAQQDETGVVNELKINGRWAAGITILCFLYGEITVASQLPVDPRQGSWLLLQSPLPSLLLCLLYVGIVTWWGPLYMSSRKPFSGLRPFMIAYNAFQVVFSAWLFTQGGLGGWFGGYKLVCQTCDFSDDPKAVLMMHGAFWYYFSKFIDFIDTIFFVLNKKYEHISVLHVSHHALMPISLWYGVRHQAGGHATFMGFINSFVHVVMYSYYLLAAMGPRLRPYLWWKKYLTMLQMVQFTIVFFHAVSVAFVECEVPSVCLRWECGIAVMFFVLFANFYIKSYRKSVKIEGNAGTKVTMPGLSNMCYIHPSSKHSYKMAYDSSRVMTNGFPNDKPNNVSNGKSNGIPNGNLNSIPNGKLNNVSNGKSNGIPNGNLNSIPNGKLNVIVNGLPNVQEYVRLRSGRFLSPCPLLPSTLTRGPATSYRNLSQVTKDENPTSATLLPFTVMVYKLGNEQYNSMGSAIYMDRKNYGWLGGALDLLQGDVDPLIVTCSPRWKNQINPKDDYYMNGACYWAAVKDLLDTGFNSHSWNKHLALLNLDTTGLEKVQLTPPPPSSLLHHKPAGYSVTSGRFWGDKDSTVAGAPRTDHTGRQLGGGYGMTVAAGDVTGDGWSELFVGAPLYVPRMITSEGNLEVPEAGEVVVYGRRGSSNLQIVATLLGEPLSPGARFGSAISVIGDLDQDGFQDVAVGAPFEDGGRGAVYVFRGGPQGLVTKPSQKIFARDIHHSLQGFGVAFSRGVDVDHNGYLDVGVGAYAGRGGAVVLRSRSVVHVTARVTSDTSVVTEPGSTFTVTLCLLFTAMKVDGGIDEGQMSHQAIFLISGTSQVTSEITLRKDADTCSAFPIKLKKCAVLAPGSSTSAKLSVPLALGCGTDGICSPTLALQADWTSGLNKGKYIIGSDLPLTLLIHVKVTKEPAYLGWLQVVLPPGLSPKNLPYTCTITTPHLLACTLTSPLYPGEEVVEVVLQEDGSLGGDRVDEEVEVVVTAGASGADSLTTTAHLTLLPDVRLALTGYTDVEYLYYNPASPAPHVTVDVFFQAENNGVTSVTEVTVEMLVPLAYIPPSEEANITFGIIKNFLVTPAAGVNLCRVESSEVVMGGVAVGGGIGSPPTDMTLKVTCGMPGVVCGRVSCGLGHLYEAPKISLQTDYNLTSLVGVWVNVVPKGWHPPAPPPKEAPFWVYFVGVAVGLTIMIIIVIILLKVGFFRRRRPQAEDDSPSPSIHDVENSISGDPDPENLEMAQNPDEDLDEPLTRRENTPHDADDENSVEPVEQSLLSGQCVAPDTM